ncbi:retrotransposon protein, putative, ty1-copia subclass [Tanacetum coccineum]
MYDTGCGTHICNTIQGLRGIQKLNKGALDLYVSNVNCTAVDAIGSFDLIIPGGMIILLDNCHFAPSITRGVILLSHLWDNGFLYKFTNYGAILVSKDNLFYFNAIPRDGIFEIDMHNHSLLHAYSIWHRKVPNLSYLKVLGCEALVKRDTPNKLESRSIKCIFVGYPKETIGYYFYYPPENKIFAARSTRIPQAPERYGFYVVTEEHELGDHVDLPHNCKTVGTNWLFKKKTNMDGNIHTYKARLVAKCFTQTYMVDYEETFSPVADIKAIRTLIDITTFYDYEIWKMDVKTTFLNGRLNEDVYMVQPEGIVNPKHPR